MIDSTVLNQLLLEAFSGQTTWLEASTRFNLDEFIDTFHHTRELMIKTVGDLTDAQASFQIDGNPTWSISEMVTHLIYSQGFYYNQLLDVSTSQLPHVVEAAKGFGEGAKLNIPSGVLQENLNKATAQIFDAIEKTRHSYDSEKITVNPAFGRCTYHTWVLLLLGHEVDHVRQGIVMRRAARTAVSGSKAPEPIAAVGTAPAPTAESSAVKASASPARSTDSPRKGRKAAAPRKSRSKAKKKAS